MGYTHYWEMPDKLMNEEILNDLKKVIKRYKDVVQVESNVSGMPIIEKDVIKFNGKGDEGHETFYLAPAGQSSFCKTNRKPYDMAVCESLLVLKHHLKEDFKLESDGFHVTKNQFANNELDGSWNTALENIKSEFGYEFDLIPIIDGNYYRFEIEVAKHEHELEPSYVEAIVDVLTKNNLSYTRTLLYGSYLQNPDTANDIDIIVEYTGNEKEDVVFEMLRGELSLDGLPVDFNPINVDMRGRDEETQPIYFPHYSEGYTKRVPIHYNESFIKDYCDLMFIKQTTVKHIDSLIERFDEDGDVDGEMYITHDGERFIVCDNSSECFVEDFKTLEEAMYWFFKEYDIIIISKTELSVIEKELNDSIAQQRERYYSL